LNRLVFVSAFELEVRVVSTVFDNRGVVCGGWGLCIGLGLGLGCGMRL